MHLLRLFALLIRTTNFISQFYDDIIVKLLFSIQ